MTIDFVTSDSVDMIVSLKYSIYKLDRNFPPLADGGTSLGWAM